MKQPQSTTPTLLDETPSPVAPAAVDMVLADSSDVALMFERLARDPAVDVDKLQRLIDMQERIIRFNAKAAFDAAFAKMQPEIPIISEKGQIEVRGTVRSTYAPLEDIHEVVKPILARHGFAMRHRTEWPNDKVGLIRIVGILSHQQGHSEESIFEAPMDRSEYRTDIQSMGSTVSYGRRYTTLDLLNISTRKMDDNGTKSGRPSPPDGYEAWWFELVAAAEKGQKALDDFWGAKDATAIGFKNYTAQHNRQQWNELKAKAAKVKAS